MVIYEMNGRNKQLYIIICFIRIEIFHYQQFMDDLSTHPFLFLIFTNPLMSPRPKKIT